MGSKRVGHGWVTERKLKCRTYYSQNNFEKEQVEGLRLPNFKTIQLSRISQLWHWLWLILCDGELCCVLKTVEENPASTGCKSATLQVWQLKISPDTAKYSTGRKTAPWGPLSYLSIVCYYHKDKYLNQWNKILIELRNRPSILSWYLTKVQGNSNCCFFVKKQQLESCMKLRTGSVLRKEYNKVFFVTLII